MTQAPQATEPIALVPDLAGCPHAAYAQLRAQGGAHRAVKPNGEPVWIITRHADVKALMSDPRMSMNTADSRHGYQGFGLPPALDRHLMNVDATDHARLRRLAALAFTPRRVDTLQDRIQHTADRLLDTIAPPAPRTCWPRTPRPCPPSSSATFWESRPRTDPCSATTPAP